MKILAIIPARLNSSRFPNKPLAKILGKPMIQIVYENTIKSKKINDCYVATCDNEIHNFVLSFGGKSVLTSSSHERATERTAEALINIEKNNGKSFDIVVMVQGDEPMIKGYMIDKSIEPFINKNINVTNLMTKIISEEEFKDKNEPKVVVDKNNFALYFSRETIPSPWQKSFENKFKQVCAIPFRKDYLMKFNNLKPSNLESIESIDMNRILENGDKIKMVLINEYVKSVDNINDLKAVEKLLSIVK